MNLSYKNTELSADGDCESENRSDEMETSHDNDKGASTKNFCHN